MAEEIDSETRIDGFVFCFDELLKKHGPITAIVYGKVYRYCRMKDGVCTARIQTMADELGVSTQTVRAHIDRLIEDEYLTETERKGYTNLYRITGKLIIKTRIEAGRSAEREVDPSRILRGGLKNIEGGAQDSGGEEESLRESLKIQPQVEKILEIEDDELTEEERFERDFAQRGSIQTRENKPITSQDQREKNAASIQAYLSKNASQDRDGVNFLSKLPEHLLPLGEANLEIFQTPPKTKKQIAFFISCLEDQYSQGIQPAHINLAFQYMLDKNLPVTTPKSLTGIAGSFSRGQLRLESKKPRQDEFPLEGYMSVQQVIALREAR